MTKATRELARMFRAFRVEASVSKTISKWSLTAKPTTAAWGVPSAEALACTARRCARMNASIRLFSVNEAPPLRGRRYHAGVSGERVAVLRDPRVCSVTHLARHDH